MQNFNNDVGQVIQAQTVNQITNRGFRRLSKDERKELHNKVKLLESNFNKKGSDTWISFHKICDVSSVDEMYEYHLAPLHKILDLLHEKSVLEVKLNQNFLNQKVEELTNENHKLKWILFALGSLVVLLLLIIVCYKF